MSATPLIDAHAHFLHAGCGRADWTDVNAARFRAGQQMGITCHVASVLGTFGFNSPTYFPSPNDVTVGNDVAIAMTEEHGPLVRALVAVNPNYTDHALEEIERCVASGAVGVKLLASRRADDALLDPICETAAKHGLPILHHIWQHRRREWPGQEISDGADLARLARRHPQVTFILAHIGGGGDYQHTYAAIRDVPNIVADLSGSGVDRGMLDEAVGALGSQRLLWACDITMETGLAKLRALEFTGLSSQDDINDIRWRNAARVFGQSVAPRAESREPMIDVNALIGPYPFRFVPHPDADVLERVLEREGLSGAWVGHLPSAFYRDPNPGNALLYTALAQYSAQLRPVPTIRPDWPDWQRALETAIGAGAPAVRVYPAQWQLGPDDPRLAELAIACGEKRVVVMLTVRFEDLRQRHPHDVAGDLQAAAVRALARVGAGVRLIVTAAGRDFIEEVHWGLTPEEQRRVVWDFSWVWGPPEDHLAKLLRSIGSDRFVFGTQWPLRLTQNPRANLDLLPDDLAGAKLADPARLFD